MIVRMFEYGFQIAKEAVAKEANALILRYPQQLVLYLERDDSIAEELKDSLYALIPFHVFTARN